MVHLIILSKLTMSACLRLGYAREEMERMRLPQLIHERYEDDLEKTRKKLLSEQHAVFEVMQIRKDRRLIPVEINAHLFGSGRIPTTFPYRIF